MKIIEKKINDLIFAEYNPRKLTKEEHKQLKDSLSRFGMVDPVIVNTNEDRKNILVGGHQRVRIWEELGNETIPSVEIDLTYEREKELNVRLNKNVGSWDMDMMANHFSVEELTDWGFKAEELFFQDDIVTDGNIPDDEVPEIKNSRVSYGDIYQLGNHRIMCGDSTSEKDVDKLMEGQKADLIFTDPPYGVSYKGTNHEIIKNDELRGEPLYDLLYGAFKNLFKFSKENPAVYIWHASKTQMIFETAIKDAGFEVKEQLIWNKGMSLGRSDYHWAHEPCFYVRKVGHNNEWFGDRKNKTILREGTIDFEKFTKAKLLQIIYAIRDESSSWEIKKDSVQTYQHPTQKPVDLCIRALVNNTEAHGIVLDLFGGSGSTLIAAEKLNRKCYTMELDQKYASVVVERWEQYTGEKAQKING
jgi:DNA modification methylase